MIFRDAPLIVWGATLLHIVIGTLLLLNPAAGRSTGPAEVVQFLGLTGAGIAMLTASVLAIGAIVLRRAADWAIIGLLLPQQVLLYVAAWGGFQAILNGQYADGVARPYEFILTDQLPIMLFALIHTLAVLELPWDRT
jgi:hypothetical protein